MILTCPQCATRYQTDATLFAPAGRKVRCAHCGHVWVEAPPPLEPEAVVPDASKTVSISDAPAVPDLSSSPQRTAYAPAPEISIPAMPRRVSPRSLEGAGVVLGWAALAVIIAMMGYSAVHYRQDIATLWPQSSSLFAVIGLPVDSRGLGFTDVSYRRENQNGQAVLAVSGKLVNAGTRELPVPSIRVSLYDGDRRELYHWSFSPNARTLGAGQMIAFLTRLPSPPPQARHLELHLDKDTE